MRRKVADNFTGFMNLKIMHCNGKDVFDSINTLIEARQHIEEHEEPVIVQANCVRIHSHSNSDAHDLYRDDYELNYVREYDPLAKYRRLLLRYERFTDEELIVIEELTLPNGIPSNAVIMSFSDAIETPTFPTSPSA